ncbi:MucBP domain-containing protein, partial [Enterococcus pallens]
MRNNRKIVYRQEAIKKYKMHKVKKNWVVKGGIAGAMLVSTVGTPLANQVSYAAENEVVDGSEAEKQKINQNTSSLAANNLKPRAGEVRDSGVTWIANETEESIVQVSEVRRTASEGATAPSVYDGGTIHNGIGFKIRISNDEKQKVNIGDKIIIPITSNINSITPYRTGLFEGISGTIPDIGTIKFISDDVGFELEVTENMDAAVEAQVNLSGSNPPNVRFSAQYNTELNQIEYTPVYMYFNGETVETITSTVVYTQTPGATHYSGWGVYAHAGSFDLDSIYTNTSIFDSIATGVSPELLDDDLIQFTNIEVESEADVANIGFGPNPSWSHVFFPSPDGSGEVIFGEYVLTNTTNRLVDVPDDTSEEDLIAILRNEGPNTCAVVKNSDGTYTVARNVGNGQNGLKLKDFEEYKQSGASTPAEFLEIALGIQYDSEELINQVNDLYENYVFDTRHKIAFDMTDSSVTHTVKYTSHDTNGVEVPERIAISDPNQIVIQGQSYVQLNLYDENGPIGTKTINGWPDETGRITAQDLEFTGYELNLSRLPIGADALTGEMDVTFPTQGETTSLDYYYTAKDSSVTVKYMLDTDGDGIGDISINGGDDDQTLPGKYNEDYFAPIRNYRSINYVLHEIPANRSGKYGDPTPDVVFVYQKVGNLIIDTTAYDNNATGSSTPYAILSDNLSLRDLEVPEPVPGYYFINEAGERLEPGTMMQPATKMGDTTWRLVPEEATVTYHYVNQAGETIATDITENTTVGASIQDKINVIEGYLYVEADAGNPTSVGPNGASVTYVYKPMGGFIWTNPDTGETITVKYPNDSTDPSKAMDPDDPEYPIVIPHVPGYTPTDEGGNKLELVDPDDPEKGYKPPAVADPGEDTTVIYGEDDESDSDSDSDSDS